MGVSIQNFISLVDVLIFYVLIFGVVYLAWCDFTTDLTAIVYQSLGKSATETLAMTRQAFGEESTSRTRKVQTHRDWRRARLVRSKIKGMLIAFLWHKGDRSQRIRPGRPNNQFRILLWRFTPTAWKCVKTSVRTLATKDVTAASRQRTASHFLFHRGIFYQKQHDYYLSPTSLFSALPDWRRQRYSGWRTIVIEGKTIFTQMRLLRQNCRRPNILTEHEFQDAFKKW
jgi:hypothetical protein